MAGPWDYFRKDNPSERQSEDASVFQRYASHPQENKSPYLEGKIEETGIAYPEVPQTPKPQYMPVQPQFVPMQYQSIQQQQPLRAETARTPLQARLEEFREKDGYDMVGYVNKYPGTPLIAGFKKQFVRYSEVNISEDPDINAAATYVANSGLLGNQRLPRKNTTVLHQFDLNVPVDTPDGTKCYFHYRRVNKNDPGFKDWNYTDDKIDETTTEGEIYTDYSLDGRPRRYFVGVATFTHVNGIQQHKRAIMIPLGRRYANREAEQMDFRRHFYLDSTPGDDEGIRLPQLETLPPRLQYYLTHYPGMLFKR